MDNKFYSLRNAVEYYQLQIASLESLAEEITSQWNGEDEKGEDMAHIANDIIEKIKELQALLDEIIEN